MRVLTWNVNGLSSTLQYYPWSEKKSYKVMLDTLASDIICFQEVKCQRSKLPRDMAIVPGYNAYFSFSKVKLGYSGVAVYIKDTIAAPRRTYEGITGMLDNNDDDDFEYTLSTPAEILDAEGRCIILDFGFFILLNIYFPNDSEGARMDFKMDYHRCVEQRIKRFLEQGREVLLVGDVNAVHEMMDHCDPKQSMVDHGLEDFKDLPQRRWLDRFIEPKGPMIDITRLYHPQRQKMFTCWNTKTNARPANYGTRIDYILASTGLKLWFKYADIQPEIMGSDHCPVYADFLDEITGSFNREENDRQVSSRLLSTNYAEFSSKQKKVSNYFMKSTPAITETNKRTTETASSKTDSVQKKKKPNDIQSFFSPNFKKQSLIKKDDNDDAEETFEWLESYINEKEISKKKETKAWSQLFSAPSVPRCKVHQETCVERTVSKKGPNLGRVFYICSKPIGPKEGPANQFNCNFFQWKTQAEQ
ncbi:hypothetical protein HPULCUR_008385 [Helicostylum pulchrum]|uniref:DNA-(apurinic or apyrimidinic site) endonuclease n=1 Tax=Helicostylum pulchrum TaxID=562976 RepID=A0ABP9Y8H9_9FUNG